MLVWVVVAIAMAFDLIACVTTIMIGAKRAPKEFRPYLLLHRWDAHGQLRCGVASSALRGRLGSETYRGSAHSRLSLPLGPDAMGLLRGPSLVEAIRQSRILSFPPSHSIALRGRAASTIYKKAGPFFGI